MHQHFRGKGEHVDLVGSVVDDATALRACHRRHAKYRDTPAASRCAAWCACPCALSRATASDIHVAAV